MHARSILPAAALLAAAIASGALPEVAPQSDRKPLSINASMEAGMIQSLRYGSEIYEQQVINRLGVWMNQEGKIDNVQFNLGLGGMYWYPFPPNASNPATVQRNFIFGITQASMLFPFGDPEAPVLSLTLGQFPFKYNPDAANLGEYIFRTRSYPTIVQTGGYVIADNSAASVMGAALTHSMWDGSITNHLLLTSETDLPPLYDFSLTYIGKASVAKVLEVGAGVSFERLLPLRPSLTTPTNLDNRYFHWNGDARLAAGDYWVRDDKNTGLQAVLADTAVSNHLAYEYYSHKSIKLMGRASLDVKPLITDGDGPFGREDLKVYTEVALLGIENYPFFYEKRSDRMPIMMGFNLPAFKLFDLVSVQAERLTTPFANDWYSSIWGGLPHHRQQNWDADSLGHKDDWRWSVIAKKKFSNGIAIALQAASDHFRTIEADYHLSSRTVLAEPGRDWYYLGRVTWGF